jgi:AraC-like DNA-binding protein
MDPLSDVLSLLKPRSYMFRGFDAAGPWSLAFPQDDGIKCYAVTSGQCWVAVEGVAEPISVTAGDCFLLPSGRPFRMASDLALPPVDAKATFGATPDGVILTIGGGGEIFGLGGYFAFGGPHAGILLSVLPPIVHIRRDADKAALRWALERMIQEIREPQPGGFLMARHLSHMLLLQALRLHLAEGAAGGVGWLFALADKQMHAAIQAMHGDPARRWTLQTLAERAGMSRSAFAVRFKESVGVSPMEYLTRWRMLLASERLASTSDPISVIAPSLGYESESAFSTAFKRVMACSPRRWGRGRAGAPAPPSRGDGEAVHREHSEAA